MYRHNTWSTSLDQEQIEGARCWWKHFDFREWSKERFRSVTERVFPKYYSPANFSPPPWHCGPTRAMAYSLLRFLDHKQRRVTVGRTSLDEWSARSRDLYLTTHNTRKKQTSMLLAGFESEIPASERPKTHTLDRAATGNVWSHCYFAKICSGRVHLILPEWNSLKTTYY